MFEFFANNYLNTIVQLVLLIVFGIVGYIFKKYMTNETVISLAKITVKFVEQVFVELHGPEKLDKAMDTLASLLKKKGIKIDKADMKVFLEAAVNEMNSVIKAPLADEGTADAVRRIGFTSDNVADEAPDAEETDT